METFVLVLLKEKKTMVVLTSRPNALIILSIFVWILVIKYLKKNFRKKAFLNILCLEIRDDTYGYIFYPPFFY